MWEKRRRYIQYRASLEGALAEEEVEMWRDEPELPVEEEEVVVGIYKGGAQEWLPSFEEREEPSPNGSFPFSKVGR